MIFKKTLEYLLTGSFFTLMGFTGLAQTPDSTSTDSLIHNQNNLSTDSLTTDSIKIKKPLFGSQIIENEPPTKKDYIQPEIDAIKNKYEKFTKNTLNSLHNKGFSSLTNNQKIENLWNNAGEIIWSRFTYKPQTWLIDGIKTGFIDCDLSAYMAGDIMEQFDINSRIIYIPQHAILKTELPNNENLYIETTNNKTIYKSKEEYQKEYPVTCGEIDFKETPNYLKHETNWITFMMEGKYENALQEANAKISLNPGFFGYTDRARTNTFLEKHSDAIKDLDMAQQIDPESSFVRLLKAKTNCHFNHFERARENYTEFLGLNKKTMEIFEKEIEITKSDREKAEIYAIKAITNLSLSNLIILTDLNYFFTYNNYFDCDRIFSETIYGTQREKNPSPEKKFLGDAQNDFTKAIELNPNIPHFYLGRAMMTVQISDSKGALDYESALRDLEKAASLADSLEPKKAWKYHLGKAKIHLDIGNLKEANKNFDIAISKIDPNKAAGLYYQKALAKHQINNYNEALENYNKALKTHETSSNNHYFSYWDLFYDLSANVPENIEKELCHCFPKFFIGDEWEILPDKIKILEQRGRCNYALKKYKEAVNDLNKTIDLGNKNFELYLLRSESKKYTHDYIGAIADLDIIIRRCVLKPDNCPTEPYNLYHKQAKLYDYMKSPEEAIKKYNEAIYKYYTSNDNNQKNALYEMIKGKMWAKKELNPKFSAEKDLKILKKLRKTEKENPKFYKLILEIIK